MHSEAEDVSIVLQAKLDSSHDRLDRDLDGLVHGVARRSSPALGIAGASLGSTIQA
ncbi:hypothetical protein COCCADRAFT_93688 [Bipolaris zeicola 26-R-13]|uniref:Uncharacterized protein n=1 Tax=Cochliobolus carbonum (strain 26-R-13) TaxID=930089 RepID=W6Y9X0_COCC2|nr:uncharacterized protein COCCADRAFT_93688 [Bipolaris zeicola 26-R-13]EUC34360.1 hypothetical protein COCCADRAFT_93688 [Bipolaris zeicola 26-R-13]